MPYVRIEAVGDWLAPQADALFDRIDAVLVAVLGVPPDDAFMRLECHPTGRSRLPRAADPRFVMVRVELFAGRSLDTKRALYQGLCAALEALGIPPGALCVALDEIALDNWGLQGGRPASELVFGFDLAHGGPTR